VTLKRDTESGGKRRCEFSREQCLYMSLDQ
jgi:hypothetical protein